MSIEKLIKPLQDKLDDDRRLSAKEIEAFANAVGLSVPDFFIVAKRSGSIKDRVTRHCEDNDLQDTKGLSVGVVLTGNVPFRGDFDRECVDIAWVVCLTRCSVDLCNELGQTQDLVATRISVPECKIDDRFQVPSLVCDILCLEGPLPGSVEECTVDTVRISGELNGSKRPKTHRMLDLFPDQVDRVHLKKLVLSDLDFDKDAFGQLCKELLNLKSLSLFTDTGDEDDDEDGNKDDGRQSLTIDLAGIPLEKLEIYGYLVNQNTRLPPSLKEFDLDPRSARTAIDAMAAQYPNAEICVTVTDDGDETVYEGTAFEVAKKLP